MGDVEVGRAVLELTVNDSTYDQAVDRADARAKGLGQTLVGIGKDLDGLSRGLSKTGASLNTAFSSDLAANAQRLGTLTRQMFGDDVIRQANQYATSVKAVGGVSKLTAAEQENLSKSVTAALQKYAALGVEAPKSLTDLAAATKTALAASTALDKEMAALQQQVSRFSGSKVTQDANAIAAAVQKIGGASKLTATEQGEVNRVVQDALAKYKALGQQAPAALLAIERETRQVEASTSAWKGIISTAIGSFAGFVSAQAVLGGVSAAFKATIGSAIDMNSTLETTTLQFTTLMGNATEARSHVADLFEFAKKTPFETGPIIEASKMMRTFGGAALDTQKNLTLLGNASAATGAPINELGFWVGRLYSNLQGGQPFGEAAMRLQELAVLSPKARQEMEGLQKSGKDASEVFGVFQESMGRFSGAMEKQAGTWSGVTSTFTDSVQLMIAQALKPLFETARDGLQIINDIMASGTFERSAEEISKSISTAFGSDSQTRVRSMAGILITVGDAAVTTGQVIGRAFQAIRLVVDGAVSVMYLGGLAMTKLAEVSANLATKVPVLGDQFKGMAKDISDARDQMWATQKSFHDGAEAALEGVKGNDAWTKSMNAAGQALSVMRAELAKSAPAGDGLFTKNLIPQFAAVGAATQSFISDLPKIAAAASGAAKSLTPFSDSIRDARAQLDALRRTAPETFRDLMAAVQSGNSSIGDMAKEYKVAELAVKMLQDQVQASKKSHTEAAAEAKKLAAAQKAIADASIELTDAQKAAALTNEALSVSHEKTARDLGVSADAIDLYIKGVKNAMAIEDDWAKLQLTFAAGAEKVQAGLTKVWRAEADASAASLSKQFTERQKYQDRVAQMGLTGTAAKLAQINREEAAEIQSLGERTVQNARFYDENKALIQQYYSYQREQATSLFGSIGPALARTLETLREAISGSFAQMLLGAKSFGEGFVDIWKSIKASVVNIFNQIADAFIQGALKKIIASLAGSSLAGGGGASTWGGLGRTALGGFSNAGTTAAAGRLIGGTAATGLIGAGVSTAPIAWGAAGSPGLVAGYGGGGAAGAGSAGLAGTAAGIAGGAGIGVGSGLLGKYIAGGAGWKAGGIGAGVGVGGGVLLGTALGLAGPTLGTSLAVAGLAGLITGLLGRSKGGKEDDQANKDLTATRTGLLGQYGSVENIAALDRAVGTDVSGGWGEAGRKGAEHFAPELQKFEDRLKAYQGAGVTLDELVRIGAPEATVEQRLRKINSLIADLSKNGGLASKDLIRLRDSMADADEVKAFKTDQSKGAAAGIGTYLSNAKVGDQGTASAIGDTLQGSYATMVGQGASAREAFAALQPMVEAFNKQLAETGLTGGASFGTLASMAGIVGNEVSGKALESINGLSTALVGAQNAGFLTQSMFTGLTGEIMKQRDAILATGASSEDVNSLMQGDLQKIWQLQQDFNFKVDDGTQALLDQAEASGTVGDKYRSAMDRAAIAMEKVAKALDKVLGLTGDVSDAIDDIPTSKTIDIDVNYRTGQIPEGRPEDDPRRYERNADDETFTASGGGVAPQYFLAGGRAVEYAATGKVIGRSINRALVAFVPKGTDDVPAMLTRNEGVANVPAMGRLSEDGLNAMNAGKPLPPRLLPKLFDTKAIARAAAIGALIAAGPIAQAQAFSRGGPVGAGSFTLQTPTFEAPRFELGGLVMPESSSAGLSASSLATTMATRAPEVRAGDVYLDSHKVGRHLLPAMANEIVRLGLKPR